MASWEETVIAAGRWTHKLSASFATCFFAISNVVLGSEIKWLHLLLFMIANSLFVSNKGRGINLKRKNPNANSMSLIIPLTLIGAYWSSFTDRNSTENPPEPGFWENSWAFFIPATAHMFQYLSNCMNNEAGSHRRNTQHLSNH